MARCAVCGGGRGEVCGDAVAGASVGQTQTAMAVGEGDLCAQRTVLAWQAQEGQQAIHSLALRSLSSMSHMLPWVASSKVCHVPLEAAM
jgi:hypothetical protein